ncbi:MAG: Gfo/Idh/MocA family protein [Roseiflexaceae bacterium]
MTQLGVAFVGLDHWYAALDLAPAVAESQLLRVVAVAHGDSAKARQVAHDCGAEVWSTDDRAALDRADVDIVVALYSSDQNVAICQEAAALGKHIVSVKPMALDLAGADAIVAAVRSAGVHFFPLECGRRVSVAGQRTKRWVDEGRIGRPLRYLQTLHSSLPIAWPGSQDTNTWWTDPARVPGGAWIDHAIYAVDMVRWLLGSEPALVQGVAERQRYPELAVEDFGIATFTLANGAIAVIEDTWTADRGYGFSRSEVVGSAGAIIDEPGAGGRVALRGDFGFDDWLSVGPPRDQRVTPIEHLAACIREECAPLATVEDGRANLAACLAFYDAARAGASVQL